MIFRFNTAQLEREMHDALSELLDVLQGENKSEIDISVVEFPKKFMVKLDGDVEMIILWDAEKKKYSGLTEPQLEPEPIPEPTEKPTKEELLALGKRADTPDIKSDVELDRSVEGIRILARNTFEILNSMNKQQRLEFWTEFSKVAMGAR